MGLGYIGLPTAALFAKNGMTVLGVDVSDHVVESVNSAHLHIVEPGLAPVLEEAVRSGRLSASASPEQAQIFIIAVPTPFRENHKPDLSYIRNAADSIAPSLNPGSLVILESTSPVGTTEQLAEWFANARPDLTFPSSAGESADVQLAYCPERVLPGNILHELVHNGRIIGGLTKTAANMARDLYKVFVLGEIFCTNSRTAEMCKLTENSFRDVNIAFANELSMICDKVGINVWELIELANKHPRVHILKPGCGVGGHCIAVDPWFLVDSSPEDARLIATARHVNDSKPDYVLDKIKAKIGECLLEDPDKKPADLKIACLGLSFKPDIDDLRESPALRIMLQLADSPMRIMAVEPNISELPPNLRRDNVCLTSLPVALAEADIIVLNVLHKSFRDNLDEIHQRRNVVDCVSGHTATE